MKNWLRRLAPGVLDRLTLLKNGRIVRVMRGARNRRKIARLVRSGKPFQVDICGPTGFGSSLTGAVLLCHYFRDCAGFRGVVSSNPLYISTEMSSDVFDMFLERQGPASPANFVTVPFRFDEDVTLHFVEGGLTLRDAQALFHQHFAVKPEFLREARALFDADFPEAVGVHYRGSDKRLESERVAFESVAATVDRALELSGCTNLFVASDEQEFLDFAVRRYGRERTRMLNCRHLSDGKNGAHFLPGNGYEKGREALLTMLILSLCKVCVRGPSHLSAWASVLHPELPVMLFGDLDTTEEFPGAIEGVQRKTKPGS